MAQDRHHLTATRSLGFTWPAGIGMLNSSAPRAAPIIGATESYDDHNHGTVKRNSNQNTRPTHVNTLCAGSQLREIMLLIT